MYELKGGSHEPKAALAAQFVRCETFVGGSLADGNYTLMGWIPGGPGPAGNPGAIDQGWHYTWGFAHGGKFAYGRAQRSASAPAVIEEVFPQGAAAS